MTRPCLDGFTRAYLACVLFTDNDDSEDPLDRNYSIEDFSEDSVKQAIADCAAFQILMERELTDGPTDDKQAGYDFWFTRNRHGVGYCDRRYAKDAEAALVEMAHRFGEVWSTVGDDGEIHLTAGHDPAALLARYRPIVAGESDEMDIAVEVLIHAVCSHIALGMRGVS